MPRAQEHYPSLPHGRLALLAPYFASWLIFFRGENYELIGTGLGNYELVKKVGFYFFLAGKWGLMVLMQFLFLWIEKYVRFV